MSNTIDLSKYSPEDIEAYRKAGFDFSIPQQPQIPKYGTPERLLFYADNCERLAVLMLETQLQKTETEHMQHEWGTVGPCGTRACALGHAALYNIVPGLQYSLVSSLTGDFWEGRRNHKLPYKIVAMVGGKRKPWSEVGPMFFGSRVHSNVFEIFDLDTGVVIQKLNAFAMRYRAEAAGWQFELEQEGAQNG
jgi:hypothetical protein